MFSTWKYFYRRRDDTVRPGIGRIGGATDAPTIESAGGERRPGPPSVLFIANTYIGDAVLSSGLIRRIREDAPSARFTVAAGPAAAPLFKDLPGLERLIVVEKRRWRLHWLAVWAKVCARRWDLVVDMRGGAIAWLTASRRRAVNRRVRGSGAVHKVVEAARTLGLEHDPPRPFLYTSRETEALARRRLGPGGPILAVGPGANWIGKRWPAERFGELAARLLAADGPLPDGRLLIVGGPTDVEIGRTIAAAVEPERLIEVGPGQMDLLTTYACLRLARLFVGNDSGAMHLAAAADAPTLGLFGPSDERLYGPWGEHARAVRGPRNFDAIRKTDPRLNQPVRHMLDLEVGAVVEAASELVARSAPAYP